MVDSSVIQMISAVLLCSLVAATALQIGGRSRVAWVRSEEAPYHVSIWHMNDYLCSGTLVGSQYVLTVAHCFAGMSRKHYGGMKIKSGSTNRLNAGEDHEVKTIIFHPDFIFADNGFHKNDVAVVKLKNLIDLNAKQQMIMISRNPLPAGTDATASGWGAKSDSALLKKVPSTVISNELCQEKVNNRLQPNEFCTYDTREPDACVTNIGSPLVKNRKLYGILTWRGECESEYPEVYVNLVPYRNFIADAMS